MKYKDEGRKYNIPLYKFAEIYEKISDSIETKPVVIGGRAINLLCYNDTRFTHDIDLVVSVNPTEKRNALNENGFMLKWGGSKVIGATYLDRYAETVQNGSMPLTIDFYYSRPVNGLRIEEILSNVNEIDVTGTSMLVPKPAIMMLLKYDAHREKDIRDFKLLLDNFYKGNIRLFFESENILLDKLLEFHINDGKKMNRLLEEYYLYKEERKSLIRLAI